MKHQIVDHGVFQIPCKVNQKDQQSIIAYNLDMEKNLFFFIGQNFPLNSYKIQIIGCIGRNKDKIYGKQDSIGQMDIQICTENYQCKKYAHTGYPS